MSEDVWNMQHLEFNNLAFTQAKLPLIQVGLPPWPVMREVQRLEEQACRMRSLRDQIQPAK